jgi:hypothetical protein
LNEPTLYKIKSKIKTGSDMPSTGLVGKCVSEKEGEKETRKGFQKIGYQPSSGFSLGTRSDMLNPI